MKLVYVKRHSNTIALPRCLMMFPGTLKLSEQINILNGLARACCYEHGVESVNSYFDSIVDKGVRLVKCEIYFDNTVTVFSFINDK